MKDRSIKNRLMAIISSAVLVTTMFSTFPASADQYIDEYQYYSTLDPNGTEYQEWKANMTSTTENASKKQC